MNFDRLVADPDNADPHGWSISEVKDLVRYPSSSTTGLRVKRAFDILFTLLLMPLVILVALPIAALVMLDGGKPVFRHQRVGRGGRLFHCFKFRTMVVDADARLRALLASNPEARREWEESYKLKNDPRITRLGWFLRKTSLDELPQVLNVLRGDMSWVGPRPIVTDELDMYGTQLPAYLACLPGITGLWQVSGRSNTTYQQRIAFDVEYAQRWSLWLDLKIVVLTIPRVLAARGSM